MLTQCSPTEMEFGRAGGRRVVADFDGGLVSSDAGALLLGETDKAIGLIDRFTACFGDHRSPLFTVHALKALIGQRVFGLALGYEDLNDHDDLRRDPVLGVLLGKLERDGDEPSPLAGKSTLNRLEHAPGAGKRPRYHKISHDGAAIERLFVELFLDAHAKAPSPASAIGKTAAARAARVPCHAKNRIASARCVAVPNPKSNALSPRTGKAGTEGSGFFVVARQDS